VPPLKRSAQATWLQFLAKGQQPCAAPGSDARLLLRAGLYPDVPIGPFRCKFRQTSPARRWPLSGSEPRLSLTPRARLRGVDQGGWQYTGATSDSSYASSFQGSEIREVTVPWAVAAKITMQGCRS